MGHTYGCKLLQNKIFLSIHTSQVRHFDRSLCPHNSYVLLFSSTLLPASRSTHSKLHSMSTISILSTLSRHDLRPRPDSPSRDTFWSHKPQQWNLEVQAEKVVPVRAYEHQHAHVSTLKHRFLNSTKMRQHDFVISSSTEDTPFRLPLMNQGDWGRPRRNF